MKYLIPYNEAKRKDIELEEKSREVFNKIKGLLNINLDVIKNDTKDLMADIIDEYELQEKDIYSYIYVFMPGTNPTTDIIAINGSGVNGSVNDFVFNLDYNEWSGAYLERPSFGIYDTFDKAKEFYKEMLSLYDYLISPMDYVIIIEIDIQYLIQKDDLFLSTEKRDFICNTTNLITHDYKMSRLTKLNKIETDIMKIAPMTNSTCNSDFSMIKVQYTYENRVVLELFYKIDIKREKDWINVIPEKKRRQFIEFCRKKNLKTSDIKELIQIAFEK